MIFNPDLFDITEDFTERIDKADTYCGKCIKADVCGMENVYDPATTYCAYRVTDRPYGEWVHAEEYDYLDENGVEHFYIKCPNCGFLHDCFDCHTAQYNFCPNCGASMSANDRQVTSKLNSENEYEAKVKELEDAIAKCEQAEKEFKSRTCKFRSPINCDFCSFHSDCEEHLKEGEAE